MTELTELEELESELLVANAMVRVWVKADARAWAKAEVSRIKAKIVKLKEQQGNE
tara:strand:+ start:437 stop:601 length:165 start_codon:yes stop_codon:yes gene_type:complete